MEWSIALFYGLFMGLLWSSAIGCSFLVGGYSQEDAELVDGEQLSDATLDGQVVDVFQADGFVPDVVSDRGLVPDSGLSDLGLFDIILGRDRAIVDATGDAAPALDGATADRVVVPDAVAGDGNPCGQYSCDAGQCYIASNGAARCCEGLVCGETCHPSGECCFASECGPGAWVCDSNQLCLCPASNVVCGGECMAPQNSCGGCTPLAAEPGTDCGTCGQYSCDGTEAVECSGDDPVNGGWGDWIWSWEDVGFCGEFAECIQSEEGSATRHCNSPEPSCGGANCAGDAASSTVRHSKSCGLRDGGWSDWQYTSWTNRGSCGQYIPCVQQLQRLGTRQCSNPAPSCGGADCVGDAQRTSFSEGDACDPIDGVWSAWSTYSTCSHECDGTQSRSRSCNNPAPACGGDDCVGAATESRGCFPVTTCGTGDWQCLDHSCDCAVPKIDCASDCRDANVCGGCASLVGTPGNTCSSWGLYLCSGTESIGCVDPRGSAAARTTAGGGGWGAGNVIDSDVDTAWSSEMFTESDLTSAQWIAVFHGTRTINHIKLWPRRIGSTPYCVPISIGILYSAGSNDWQPLATATLPEDMSQGYRVDIPETSTDGIMLTTVRLRPDSFGGYYFQMAEIAVGYD